MKLMDLRSALRKTKGNPSIVVELTPGVPMTFILQKTPLLEELGRAFGGERTADTGLTYDEDTGIISGPLSAVAQDDAPAPDFEDGDDVVMPEEDDELL